MTVAVIADSAASLPAELAARWGIRIVPLQVTAAEESWAEGVDIGPDEVVARLRAGDDLSTSQPSPDALDAAIAGAVADGAEGVVLLTLSATLSGTCDAARAAAERAGVRVEVVDTRTVAMAMGFAVIAAAQAARAGATVDGAADAARTVAGTARCVFYVETLDHLRRGGRIGPAVATVGRVLGIRPVLEVVDGEVIVASRARSLGRARAALHATVDEAVARCAHPAVAVMGVGAGALVDEVAAEIEQRHPEAGPVVTGDVSAVLAAHAGPGTLAAVVADLPG
ncbi:DegV family protein [Demequina mangrovi]|uniref:EDD domain protein, DegV family n=1 Tax=Demequina mangrovi TaxID=1043493 RepID=A0A1H6V6X9_9MICO|nr:DegV family protein [Demequina mangrovi]SEI96400.1 EDD domain protein, DegV family [Demequina mangrovi]